MLISSHLASNLGACSEMVRVKNRHEIMIDNIKMSNKKLCNNYKFIILIEN